MDLRSQPLRNWILLGLLFVFLFALESVVVHNAFTVRYPGANDFYSRWAGARAFLLEGHDPYSLEVTEEIQPVIGIDPSEVGRGGFAYPLYVIFLFWPLVFVPYAWAQAIWMVTLQWVAVGIAIVLMRREGLEPSPVGMVGLLLGTLFLYPVTRTIFLGQFTLHVTLALAATLLALHHERDGWAGAFLALSVVKPQMVILIGPWLVLWAISQRRWRFIRGLLIGGAVLGLGSLALFPRWPLSFLEDVRRYDDFAGGRNPLAMVGQFFWPQNPDVVRYGLTGVLLLVMGAAWVRGCRRSEEGFAPATDWTIVVSLLVFFQTGTTNYVMLLIPFFAWWRAALDRWGVWPAVGGTAVLEVALWGLFAATISGDWENPVMFLVLPLLSLAVLVGSELIRWRRTDDATT